MCCTIRKSGFAFEKFKAQISSTSTETVQLISTFVFAAKIVLVWGESLRSVNIFSVMSGRSHRFLGKTSTFWEVNVSCSRIQHGDLSEDRTPDLSSDVLLDLSLNKCMIIIFKGEYKFQ